MAAKKSAKAKTSTKKAAARVKASTKKAAAKRMGRPPKSASERKGLKIMVRVTSAQKAILAKRAEKAGLDLSNYMLNAALGLLSNP